jgi:hypothetical protein
MCMGMGFDSLAGDVDLDVDRDVDVDVHVDADFDLYRGSDLKRRGEREANKKSRERGERLVKRNEAEVIRMRRDINIRERVGSRQNGDEIEERKSVKGKSVKKKEFDMEWRNNGV